MIGSISLATPSRPEAELRSLLPILRSHALSRDQCGDSNPNTPTALLVAPGTTLAKGRKVV